jgi:hypothetical protein
MIGFRV